MSPSTWRVIVGDVRDWLATLPDQSVQMVCTSPPYWGLRDYGVEKSIWDGSADCVHVWGDTIGVNATNHTDKRRWNHTRNGRDEEQPTEKRVAWLRTIVDQGNICQTCGAWRGALGLEPTPDLFVTHIVNVFRAVRRVLRDDGVLWLNLGDSYQNAKGQAHGVDPKQPARRHGLRPNDVSIEGLKPKDLAGVPWMVAFALRADGWYLRSDIIWAKPNPMPESVTDRPTKAHEYVFLLTKRERYYYDADAIAEPASLAMEQQIEQGYDGLGLKDYDGAGVQNPSSVKARIITNARRKSEATGANGRNVQASNSESERRDEVGTFNNNPRKRQAKHRTTDPQAAGHRILNNVAAARAAGVPHDSPFGITRNVRSVWTIPTQPYPNAHFATFPEAIPERCIKAGSKLGDTILDP